MALPALTSLQKGEIRQALTLRLHKDERFGCVIIAIAKKRQRRPIA
ncbi:hypothetical protein BSS2_I1583 [Brucella suis bv. 1 str. S2]|uniref:Uncharacterized protein n=4 Tax=Brucella TaxID=234 RepID=Q2YQB5_BRUA2|nr:hypothetical protein BR1633 [Brucella suis 1330]AAX74941.1 hypothetical protein BruAb1_1621 [Brucella abortus bv. 1 str. 9-941]ACU48610.1 hypothetical protein BMI_I1651 [Brucella microti CCM 4915]AEK54936.1 hypothetical protein BPI_I1690 [Brucella pinnipedialis B2/94]AEU06622.1 hypothetical protein BSVBI22_A1629 [Brucella suis VBI22]AHN47236.1 hypothetical protein BSS2_I1583 [Brucella suis bv. 1 str. S2]CAJ11607.1 conserved hypothetical protein [Brucella abortus 2308]CDL77014.1 unnamed pr